MTIFDLSGILRKTWPQSAVSGKIIKGFEVTGIYHSIETSSLMSNMHHLLLLTDPMTDQIRLRLQMRKQLELIQAIRVRTPQVLMKLRFCQLLPPVKIMATLRNQIQE